jgi:serine/threonine protein kinase
LLLDRISVGGMAEVFKAKSYGVEGFEKIIAIKRILPTMGEDRDFIKMFIDEAKIAGQLAHANICQIFELGRIDGSHFIAMEYIWGKDLLQIQNRLRKIKQQMPIPMACFSIAKVLEGLDYAHRKRDAHGRPLEIVHRDCSPQNVLVSYEGEVKVIDFGIAKATSRNSRTMAGVLKGKFGYMSPEQVRGLPLDRRSDIFALGTMLYECLTGERLFMGETDFSTLEKVRNVDIRPPRELNPAIPESVERVILKALAKDVDDRYQWCSEMLADLQQYLMGQDVVFTAKSLSSWLKEIFAQEIDRERAQLEQYKRIGRDGLIGGLPQAEADRDIVSHLGEAGAPEGDATTLGGPNFDDIEQAAGAAPEVGPPQRAATEADNSGRAQSEDGDFGEEAPTEIFGDDTQPPPPPRMPVAASPSFNDATVGPPPATRTPIPGQPNMPRSPARAPTMQRPAELSASASGQRPTVGAPPPPPPPSMSGQMAAMNPNGMMGPNGPNGPNGMMGPNGQNPMMGGPPQQPMMYSQASPPAGVPQQYPTNPAYGYPNVPMGSDPGAVAGGTPGAFPGQAQSGKTVLGMQAPQYHPTGPQQAQPQYPYPQYPSQPSMQMPPYGSGGQQPYGYGANPVTPHDPALTPAVDGKRSTLMRDIAIGVAIAAVVLGGFFVVKFVILDKSEPPAPKPTIATIRLSMTPGVAADLFVDDKKIGAVSDKQEIPVTAGNRHVALVGPNGTKCDEQVTLEAGKTTTLECKITAAAGSAAGSAALATGSNAGSAVIAPTAAGSNAGSAAPTSPMAGSAATVPAPQTNAAALTTAPKPDVAKVEPPKPDVDKTVAKPVKVEPPKVKTEPTARPEVAKTADAGGKGYLMITSKPSARIAVDGVDTGLSTPISGKALSLTPGKHKITFIMGDDRYTFPVTITGGQSQSMNKDLE